MADPLVLEFLFIKNKGTHLLILIIVIKFTPKGVKIPVSIYTIPGKSVELSVKDTGCGRIKAGLILFPVSMLKVI